MHGGATDFGIAFCSVIIAIIVLPVCVYDLTKRRLWGIAGIVLALTPFPICYAILKYAFHVKNFQVIE